MFVLIVKVDHFLHAVSIPSFLLLLCLLATILVLTLICTSLLGPNRPSSVTEPSPILINILHLSIANLMDSHGDDELYTGNISDADPPEYSSIVEMEPYSTLEAQPNTESTPEMLPSYEVALNMNISKC